MSNKWTDGPDAEGFWWVLAKDGSGRERRTVACVNLVDNTGMVMFHLVGYTQQFTDLDMAPGRPLNKSKWKRIPES